MPPCPTEKADLTLFCYSLSFSSKTACGNYVIDSGEQCDDGNPFSGDGCSSTCQLEDQSLWLCTNSTGNTGPTTCCRALYNPDTTEKVCSCSGYQTNSTLYSITASCNKLNIDECTASTSTCHRNAICSDLNGAAAGATQGFECICPPGLLGDGITECQLYAYLTQFVVVAPETPPSGFDDQQFKELLISSGTISTNISLQRITLNVQEYTPPPSSSGRRSLVVTGSSSSSLRRSSVMMQEKLQTLRRTKGRRNLLENAAEDSALEEADAKILQSAAEDDSSLEESDAKIFQISAEDRALEEADARNSGSTAAERRLLQSETGTGSSITVTIASVTAGDQILMTATTNLTNLESLGYVAVSQPVSTMSATESIDDPTHATVSGFQITSVQYNDTDSRFVLCV